MQNVEISVDHYKLRVVEAPTLKMKPIYKDDQRVGEEPASGPNGEALYEVVLYSRARQADDYGRKDSEEVKVTLSNPCEDIEEDDVVELVSPTMSTYSFTSKKGTINGVKYAAEALSKVS